MTKNIFIGVLLIALAGSVVFSISKDSEANGQEALAVASAYEATMQRDAADMARKEAEEQRMIAIYNVAEAQRQNALMEEALKKCKGK